MPQNVANRVRDFENGRRLYPRRGDLDADAGVYSLIGEALLGRWQVYQRLASIVRRPRIAEVDADAVASMMLDDYSSTITYVSKLGEAWGFVPIFVWQPTLYTTEKVLTDYERELTARVAASPIHAPLAAVHQAVSRRIGSEINAENPAVFLDFSCVFDGMTEPIFGDEIGHTYEEANPVIVEALWPILGAALAGPAESATVKVSGPCS